MAPESSGAFFADILQEKAAGRNCGNHLILTAVENDSTLRAVSPSGKLEFQLRPAGFLWSDRLARRQDCASFGNGPAKTRSR
jgi:hypothetical protein